MPRVIPPASSAPPQPEPPRLLAARSEYGYTDRPDRALPGEPEAISAGEQRAISEQAAKVARLRALAVWDASRDRILDELRVLGQTRFEQSLDDDLRTIARAVERVERRLRGRSLAFSA